MKHSLPWNTGNLSQRLRAPRFIALAAATLGLLLTGQGSAHAASVRPTAAAASGHRPTAAAASGQDTELSAAGCAALSGLHLASTTVDRARADTTGSFAIPAGQMGAGSVIRGLPSFCEVSLTQSNPPASDQVNIEIWLPLQGWNGRFQGVGGGGFVSGISWQSLAPALEAGYATASTDAGHPASQSNGSFALNPNGTLDWPEITDFAYRAIHEMTVDAKAIISSLYGTGATYSYFNGCSTGGRQALMEAQRYPDDYNGILAGSPAINWSKFMVAQIWPEFVMKELGDYLPQCKLNAFRQAAISDCEVTGGVNYSEIMNPADCHFNPYSLVGKSTPCGSITRTDAQAVELILRGETASFPDGKFLWYGLEPGTDFSGLADTTTSNGVTSPSPLSLSVEWFQYWLTQNPNFNWKTLTVSELDRFFVQSETEFSLLETDNPDLSAFRDNGGKILIWTGLADQLIYPQGAIQYYDRVTGAMGGLERTQSFARLFLAPGNGHCGGDSVGPVASGQFTALTNWVEHGTAPTTLVASETTSSGAVTETRPLCAYPDGAVYNGSGSIDDAANFHCAPTFSPAGP